MKTAVKISLAVFIFQFVSASCAHAQRTINLSTKENVLEQIARQKKEKFDRDMICIERPKEWEKIIIIGFGRYDTNCRFDGAFVNSIYYEMPNANLSKIALEAIGWKKAGQAEREKLALFWVEKGLLAFSDVLYEKHKNFTASAEFHPPQIASTANGEIIIAVWTGVMKRKLEFERREFGFTKDGNLSESLTSENAQNISNQDLPKLLPDNSRGCLKKILTESGEIEISGVFRSETGCHFANVFVNSQYLEENDPMLSKTVLAAFGWEKANQARREKLAKLWVEKGLLAFSRVLYTKDEDMRESQFQPPQVVSAKNGEIKVTLWVQMPPGMVRRTKEFKRLEFIFASDGAMTKNSAI